MHRRVAASKHALFSSPLCQLQASLNFPVAPLPQLTSCHWPKLNGIIPAPAAAPQAILMMNCKLRCWQLQAKPEQASRYTTNAAPQLPLLLLFYRRICIKEQTLSVPTSTEDYRVACIVILCRSAAGIILSTSPFLAASAPPLPPPILSSVRA